MATLRAIPARREANWGDQQFTKSAGANRSEPILYSIDL